MSWTAIFVAALSIMSGAEPWGDGWSAPLSYLPHAEHSAATEVVTRRDLAELRGCQEGRGCTWDQLRFLSMIEPARKASGRAQLGILNRAINGAIRAEPDTFDEWYGPMETVARNSADCEDYAIVKLFALRALGWDTRDLALMIMYDPRSRQYHAVAAARLDGAWLLLDCLTLTLVTPDRTRYIPFLLLRNGTVRRYTMVS